MTEEIAWFQRENPQDKVKATIPSALWASMTISLGSMALNAMITDLINLTVWILENIIDSSEFRSCAVATAHSHAEVYKSQASIAALLAV
jgi:hypothetical protein